MDALILDEIDFRILKVLDRKCRTPYSEIANKLNLSVRAISNRISSMMEMGVIKYFSVAFNYTRLGYRNFIASCRPNEGITPENLYFELQNIPEITELWQLLDGSITFPFFIKNSMQLEDVLNRILKLKVKLNGYVESRMHLSAEYPFSPTDWRIIYNKLQFCHC
ncbi:MAG: Lrp/AsnC family transcriptional regulator [Candidatus Hermodarchaeota archaeon]